MEKKGTDRTGRPRNQLSPTSQNYDVNHTVVESEANRPVLMSIGVLNSPIRFLNRTTTATSSCSRTTPVTSANNMRTNGLPIIRYQNLQNIPYRLVSQSPNNPNQRFTMSGQLLNIHPNPYASNVTHQLQPIDLNRPNNRPGDLTRSPGDVPSTSRGFCDTPKGVLKRYYSVPKGSYPSCGSSPNRPGMTKTENTPKTSKKSIKISKKKLTALNVVAQGDSSKKITSTTSSSVTNFLEQDILEKGTEVLESLDDQSLRVLIRKVMDLTNKMYGQYLAEELEKHLGTEKYREIANGGVMPYSKFISKNYLDSDKENVSPGARSSEEYLKSEISAYIRQNLSDPGGAKKNTSSTSPGAPSGGINNSIDTSAANKNASDTSTATRQYNIGRTAKYAEETQITGNVTMRPVVGTFKKLEINKRTAGMKMDASEQGRGKEFVNYQIDESTMSTESMEFRAISDGKNMSANFTQKREETVTSGSCEIIRRDPKKEVQNLTDKSQEEQKAAADMFIYEKLAEFKRIGYSPTGDDLEEIFTFDNSSKVNSLLPEKIFESPEDPVPLINQFKEVCQPRNLLQVDGVEGNWMQDESEVPQDRAPVLGKEASHEKGLGKEVYYEKMLQKVPQEKSLGENESLESGPQELQREKVPNKILQGNRLQQKVSHETVLQDTMIDNELQQNVPHEGALKETMHFNKKLQQKVPTEAVLQERMPHNNKLPKKVPNEAVLQERMPHNNKLPKKVPNEAVLRKTVPHDNTLQPTVPNEAVLQEKTPHDNELQQKVLLNEAVLLETINHDNKLQQKVPNETVLEKTMPHDNIKLQQKLPNETVLLETINHDNKLQQKLPNETVLQKTMPHDNTKLQQKVPNEAVLQEIQKIVYRGEVPKKNLLDEKSLQEKIVAEKGIQEMLILKSCLTEKVKIGAVNSQKQTKNLHAEVVGGIKPNPPKLKSMVQTVKDPKQPHQSRKQSFLNVAQPYGIETHKRIENGDRFFMDPLLSSPSQHLENRSVLSTSSSSSGSGKTFDFIHTPSPEVSLVPKSFKKREEPPINSAQSILKMTLSDREAGSNWKKRTQGTAEGRHDSKRHKSTDSRVDSPRIFDKSGDKPLQKLNSSQNLKVIHKQADNQSPHQSNKLHTGHNIKISLLRNSSTETNSKKPQTSEMTKEESTTVSPKAKKEDKGAKAEQNQKCCKKDGYVNKEVLKTQDLAVKKAYSEKHLTPNTECSDKKVDHNSKNKEPKSKTQSLFINKINGLEMRKESEVIKKNSSTCSPKKDKVIVKGENILPELLDTAEKNKPAKKLVKEPSFHSAQALRGKQLLQDAIKLGALEKKQQQKDTIKQVGSIQKAANSSVKQISASLENDDEELVNLTQNSQTIDDKRNRVNKEDNLTGPGRCDTTPHSHIKEEITEVDQPLQDKPSTSHSPKNDSFVQELQMQKESELFAKDNDGSDIETSMNDLAQLLVSLQDIPSYPKTQESSDASTISNESFELFAQTTVKSLVIEPNDCVLIEENKEGIASHSKVSNAVAEGTIHRVPILTGSKSNIDDGVRNIAQLLIDFQHASPNKSDVEALTSDDCILVEDESPLSPTVKMGKTSEKSKSIDDNADDCVFVDSENGSFSGPEKLKFNLKRAKPQKIVDCKPQVMKWNPLGISNEKSYPKKSKSLSIINITNSPLSISNTSNNPLENGTSLTIEKCPKLEAFDAPIDSSRPKVVKWAKPPSIMKGVSTYSLPKSILRHTRSSLPLVFDIDTTKAIQSKISLPEISIELARNASTIPEGPAWLQKRNDFEVLQKCRSVSLVPVSVESIKVAEDCKQAEVKKSEDGECVAARKSLASVIIDTPLSHKYRRSEIAPRERRIEKFKQHRRRLLQMEKIKKLSKAIKMRIRTVGRNNHLVKILVQCERRDIDREPLNNVALREKIEHLQLMYDHVNQSYLALQSRKMSALVRYLKRTFMVAGKTNFPRLKIEKRRRHVVRRKEEARARQRTLPIAVKSEEENQDPDEEVSPLFESPHYEKSAVQTYRKAEKGILRSPMSSFEGDCVRTLKKEGALSKSVSFPDEIRKSSLDRDINGEKKTPESPESIVRVIMEYKNTSGSSVRNAKENLKQPTVKGKEERSSTPKRPRALRSDAAVEHSPPSKRKKVSAKSPSLQRSYILRSRSIGNRT